MNSFFYKKPNGIWTWASPDGKTKNEIDFIITDKKSIVNNVTVLNQLFIGSGNSLVRALININVKKAKTRIIKTKTKKKWQEPEKTITKTLKSTKTAVINELEKTVTEALIQQRRELKLTTQYFKK